MKCKTYKRLYKLFPMIRWRAFLLDRHFSQCSACLEEFAIENQIDSIGVTPGTVETVLQKEGMDLWPRVEERLIAVENKQNIYSTTRGNIAPPKRAWGWVLAGAAVLALVLLIPPVIRQGPGGNGNEKSLTVQDNHIKITSVTVENRPAKTIYFQPGNKNRLIVWVKKM